ncbi:tryptophan halogenase family protein [Sphingomonas sp. Leaf25]|uniref:tryptophan halogenase family protein n=1 Tax=Sphingomonas sp. Leaf25 TaxID=1735692 RepID=UPI0006F901F8|nr:tryptophan halogenase family protein [Sphingomonas sp. Leaf25]KQN06850.1 tryptophan halogenase [Sphingomonas sp. Leaf25]
MTIGQQAIATVAIVGGGSAGWMTAAALARFLPPGVEVTLIESDAIGTVGVGEATIPQLRLFNQNIGIDEDDFVARTGGSFKLGIEFAGWNGEGSRYLHAFGTIGRALGLVPFHHYWLAAGGAGDPASLWRHSACAAAAQAGRFGRDPGSAQAPSGLAWAYHFDAARYATYLRDLAERGGVTRVEGRVVDVALSGGDTIAAVTLADGRRIAADFFIDCSGFAALLIGRMPGSAWDDWSSLLPCDRALAVPCAATAPITPYTRATARAAGWQWRIPLQGRTGNGLVYASDYLSDDAALATLLGSLDGTASGDPRPLRFTTGRRRLPWIGNCVALGLAAGFLEPLESTSIHLVQSGIARLLALWPSAPPRAADIAAFNRQSEREWIAVRDFLIAHYVLNGRDEPFWRDRRATPLPDSLAERIELFRGSGRILRDEHELFAEVAWLQLLIGQGVVPEGHHPLVRSLPAARLPEFLSLSAAHVEAIVARMATHDEFLRAHCPAAQTKVAA